MKKFFSLIFRRLPIFLSIVASLVFLSCFWSGVSEESGFSQSTSTLFNLRAQMRSPERGGRYLFALHYYEQLGRATSNLFDLASLGSYGNRTISLPFARDSRLSGVPFKTNSIDHISSRTFTKSYSPLDIYYDLTHFNDMLSERGYSTFVSFDEFKSACHLKIDVMVHFIYPESNTFRSTSRWFGLSEKDLHNTIVMMKELGGLVDMSWVSRKQLSKELRGVKIPIILFVDPTIIISPEILEIMVFRKRKCVGVLFWKGFGEKDRTSFSLHPSITHRLHNSDLKHNQTILDTAHSFVEKTFSKSEFISVHIRAEKLLLDHGLKKTLSCLETAALLVSEIRETYAFSKIFLSTDFSSHGSDTFVPLTKYTDRDSLKDYFINRLDKTPETFESRKTVDKGVVSLIEMNILAQGSFLVTVGRGYFHNWVVDYFLAGRSASQVKQVCSQKPGEFLSDA